MRKQGFTLVELLVAISIIAILISMLLPAIQSARESARRTQCANNLKQLSLAVLTHETSEGRLPPAGLVAGGGTFESRSGRMMSWIVTVLPFLEQDALHGRFEFGQDILNQPHEPQETQIGTLLCPSDNAAGRMFEHPELTQGKRFAKGNYAAYVSPFHTDLQNSYPGAIAGTGLPMALIRDGASGTVMLTEIRTRDYLQDQRGAWALPWTGASLLAFDMHHGSGRFYTAGEVSRGLTQRPNNRGPLFDMLYHCPEAATAQMERMPCAVYGSGSMRYLSAAPRSHHLGGVQASFVDGHIEFLADEVDEYAMASMVSIHDEYAK